MKAHQVVASDSERILLVVGASGGIGSAIVAGAAEVGYHVLAPSRDQLDLSHPESVELFLKTRVPAIPHAVILSAGVNNPQDLSSLSSTNWRHTIEVNLNSSLRIIQDLGLRMASLKRGHILAISSCYATRSRVGRIAYSASKAALNAVVSGSAVELAPHNVLVNGLAPGFVGTELTFRNNSPSSITELQKRIPLARLGTPEEIARVALFLVDEGNTYLTGQVIAVDGGFLCL